MAGTYRLGSSPPIAVFWANIGDFFGGGFARRWVGAALSRGESPRISTGSLLETKERPPAKRGNEPRIIFL